MKMDLRCGESDAREISTTVRLRELLRESEERYRTLHASISAILARRMQLPALQNKTEKKDIKPGGVEPKIPSTPQTEIPQTEKSNEKEIKTKTVEVRSEEKKPSTVDTKHSLESHPQVGTKHSQPSKQSLERIATKAGDIYTFHCIHCDQALQLEKPHMQYQPIRCAVYKHNSAVVEVNISDSDCKILHDSGRIYGCGKLMILDTLTLKVKVQ